MQTEIEEIVTKRIAEAKHIDAVMLRGVLTEILGMHNNELQTIMQVLGLRKKSDKSLFRYIGRHAADNAVGKTVRVPHVEFVWCKRPMIQLGWAVQNVNTFMYHFGNLAPNEQENLTKITTHLAEIEQAAKSISKLASVSRPKTKTPKSKNIKEQKKQLMQSAEEEPAGVSEPLQDDQIQEES